jgi:hypothetical protein
LVLDPGSATTLGCLKLDILQKGTVIVGALPCGRLSIDTKCPGQAETDLSLGKILALCRGHECVEALVFSIAPGIGKGGMDLKGFLELGSNFLGRSLAQFLGCLD